MSFTLIYTLLFENSEISFKKDNGNLNIIKFRHIWIHLLRLKTIIFNRTLIYNNINNFWPYSLKNESNYCFSFFNFNLSNYCFICFFNGNIKSPRYLKIFYFKGIYFLIGLLVMFMGIIIADIKEKP